MVNVRPAEEVKVTKGTNMAPSAEWALRANTSTSHFHLSDGEMEMRAAALKMCCWRISREYSGIIDALRSRSFGLCVSPCPTCIQRLQCRPQSINQELFYMRRAAGCSSVNVQTEILNP